MGRRDRLRCLSVVLVLLFSRYSFAFANAPQGLGPASWYEEKELTGTAPGTDTSSARVHIATLLDKAVEYKDDGYYEDAAKVLREGLGDHPDEPDLLRLLARIEYLSARPHAAIKNYQKLLRRHPKDASLFEALGSAYAEIPGSDAAVKYLKRALEIDRGRILSHWTLAGLYAKRDRRTAAIIHYEAVLRIDPGFSPAYARVAPLYEASGRLQEALEAYKKAVSSASGAQDASIRRVRLKLGGARHRADSEKRQLEKMKPSPHVTAPVFDREPVRIRVGLVRNADSLEFKASSAFRVLTQEGRELSVHPAEKIYRITHVSESEIVIAPVTDTAGPSDRLSGPFRIETIAPEGTLTLFRVAYGAGHYWASNEDRSYRGRIQIDPRPAGMTVVNLVTLEEYLYGVVPSEMPASWPLEALKAQAVAARSEALSKLARHAGDGFDLCSEVHCQVYSGVGRENAKVRQAVDETRGLIMTSDGRPVDAVYSSICGGHTQDNIFGAAEPISYLQGRIDRADSDLFTFPDTPYAFDRWIKRTDVDVFCNVSSFSGRQFRWVRAYTPSELAASADLFKKVGPVEKVIVRKRGRSGHATQVEIVGSLASAVIDKELNIRTALGGLRSGLFKVETKYSPDGKPEVFIFYGGGWGHGVGMCQAGAAGMAKMGTAFDRILEHYYRGVRFKKLY